MDPRDATTTAPQQSVGAGCASRDGDALRQQQPPGPSPRWYVAATVAAAAPLVFLALPPDLARTWYHVVCLGTTAVAAVLVHRSPAIDRRPWWCFVAALGLFSVRDLVMSLADVADPDPLVVAIDAVPMGLGYILLCSAAISLVRIRARGGDRDSLVDAAVVAAAVATVVWVRLAGNPAAGMDYAITAAHAILQALLIALAVRFMFTGAGSLMPAWLLFSACVFAFLGNLGAVLTTVTVVVAPHNWIGACWILAWCCVPLAASHPRMAEVAAPAGEQATVSTPRLLVLGAALLGTPVVVLSQVPTTTVGLAAGLGSVLVTLLGLVRVVRLVRALELVRRQQQVVVQLGQLGLAGAPDDQLVAAASTAMSAGLHAARVDVVLGEDVGASAPAQVRRELAVAGDRLGTVLITTGRVLSSTDRTFIDAVASTLASSVARSRAEEQVRHWAGELAAQNHDLELANQFKIDLMGVLAHEIGNPLTTILLHSETMAEDLANEEAGVDEVLHAFRVVERNALQISRVLNDLLVLVSSDSGVLRAHPEPTRLAPVLTAAAESQPPAVRPAVVCPPDLCALVQPVHLEQMLANLLSNATKYAGGSTALTASPVEGGQVEITVADEGPGVPDEFRGRLFERFSREGAAAEKVRGTGLGLFITRELARANDGDIIHRPAEPHGSQFVIILRRASSTQA